MLTSSGVASPDPSAIAFSSTHCQGASTMRSRTFVLAILSVFMPCFATAAVIHVPADQPTIQAGIDAAQNGDTSSIASYAALPQEISHKGGLCYEKT